MRRLGSLRSMLRCGALSGLVLLLGACAGPAKLAQQSDEALAHGDLHKAYDRALRAIEKDPQNQPAREAYTAASARIATDFQNRVTAQAVTDTLGAANLDLEFQAFRGEVSHHQTALPPAGEFEDAEHAILDGAARTHYARGRAAMAAHRPKAAVGEYVACQRFDAGYADVAARLDAALRVATARVALLPFGDDIGVPGLSQEVGAKVQDAIARRAGKEFHFTQIVDGAELDKRMTVAQLRELRPEEALVLGHRVGADRIVVGRFRGMRSTNSEREVTLPLYRRLESTDDKGVTIVRWQETSMRVVTRERDVTVQYVFDVLDVASGTVLAHREEPAHTIVRTAWTDFRPDPNEDCGRYALLPPDVRKAEPERARTVDAQWRDHLGSWDVKGLLERARDERGRARYSTRYRGEFFGDTRQRPVWVGELPSENDMAGVALNEAWKPVLAVLKDLDAKD